MKMEHTCTLWYGAKAGMQKEKEDSCWEERGGYGFALLSRNGMAKQLTTINSR